MEKKNLKLLSAYFNMFREIIKKVKIKHIIQFINICLGYIIFNL